MSGDARSWSCDSVSLGVTLLETEIDARAGAIRMERSAAGLEHAVEQDAVDPGVVVEVLEVPHVRHRASRMGVQ